MMKKVFIVAFVILTALTFAGTAMAQAVGYGMSGTMAGSGACGCGSTTYGAPQDCMATVSCNVPMTQMVPYQTTTCEMQTVNYPVAVPQQSSVVVPEAVIVQKEVPVTTYTTACAQTQVPVQVPTVAYQPVTSMIPQSKTFSLGNAPASMGASSSVAPGSVGLGSDMPRGMSNVESSPLSMINR